MYDKPVFRIMGDRGLLVEVGGSIAPDINAGVQTLLCGLSARRINGIIDLVPGYRTLLVVFDPRVVAPDELRNKIAAIWEGRAQIALPEVKTHQIPVIYGGEHGPDLQWVADYHHMPIEAVVKKHTAATYRVYMIGFTPGYPYMGELPAELDTPRRDTPRTHVPRGSVGIAQRQTGIYPVTSPGGWQIIGWTPISLFDPATDPPAHLQMGDWVRFIAIGPEDFA